MEPNREQIFGVFDDLMKRTVEPKIYGSFRKYATARDDLIATISVATGIPEQEFLDRIANNMADELIRSSL